MYMYASRMINDDLSIDQLSPDDLKKERAKTSKREFAEIVLRLKSLTKEEIEYLADSNIEDRKHVALLAFGRTYSFFGDFIREIVENKISLFDLQLTDRDYNAFVSKKSIDHDELDQLADSTKYKIKQVTMKVLAQAGVIDDIKNRNIIVPHLDSRLERIIVEQNPSCSLLVFQLLNCDLPCQNNLDVLLQPKDLQN